MEVTTISTTQQPDNSEPEDMYYYINNFLNNPSVFIILIIVIVVYFVIFLSLGNNNVSNTQESYGENYNKGTSTIMIVFIGILIVLVVINGLQYFFNLDIITSIKNLFTGEPEIDIIVDQPKNTPTIGIKPQVFNIPGNYYGYEDAKSLCKAYDSRLASYTEIEDSYNKGAEWCNYGWSDQQMALFPTQQQTFDNLQEIPGHEHDCGRPGVNGGYIANPRVKFGVNCFGYKPRISTEEEEMMQNTTPYPETEKDIAMEKRVDYWKNKINEILISPFNYNNWSKI